MTKYFGRGLYRSPCNDSNLGRFRVISLEKQSVNKNEHWWVFERVYKRKEMTVGCYRPTVIVNYSTRSSISAGETIKIAR